MYDVKLISINISSNANPFHFVKEIHDGNANVYLYDSPYLEKALKPYLSEGYRVLQTIKIDGAFYTFLLEKD